MSGTFEAAVLTISDRCAAGTAEDASGPAVMSCLADMGAAVTAHEIVSDDAVAIQTAICAWLAHRPPGPPALIVTTGGTGFGPRDLTPEAVEPLLERRADSLMELSRSRCGKTTPFAFLSRGIAGVAGSTLIITVPGSPRGATESLQAMADVLPHAPRLIAGSADPHPPENAP